MTSPSELSTSPSPDAPASKALNARKKKRRKTLLRIAAVFLSLALVGGGGLTLFRMQKDKEIQAKIDKRKIKAAIKDVRKELALTGKVLPSSSVVVFSPVSGIIKDIFVQEGERVKQDQNLFSVLQDTSGQRELESRRADVERARLELRAADEDFGRRNIVKDLFSKAENEKLEMDRARKRLDYDNARQAMSLIESTLGLSGAESRPQAKGTQRNSIIFVKAPRGGIVTFISKFTGETVLANVETAESNGREVVTVAELDKMLVRSRILESDLASVRVGKEVDVQLDAFRDKVYKGRISRISQQGVEDRSAGYTYFVIDVTLNRPDADVRSNMNATITILIEEKKHVLTLPANAVATLGGHSIVELPPGKDKKPRYKAVKTGLSNEQLVEITDASLKPDDEVLEIDFAELDLKELAKGNLGKEAVN